MRTVRQLASEDWEAVRALRLRALQDSPTDFGGAYEDEIAWPEARWRQTLTDLVWFGATSAAGLNGCVILRIPEGAKLRHNGWLHGMYVSPAARGSGAADALMEAAEACGKAAGVAILKLYVSEDNARAAAFYRRRGFVAYGREPDSHRVDGVSYSSLEMAKPLV